MAKIACGDVVSGCGWSATANENELLQKIADHAKKITRCLQFQTN